jgi:hypothetical protein
MGLDRWENENWNDSEISSWSSTEGEKEIKAEQSIKAAQACGLELEKL